LGIAGLNVVEILWPALISKGKRATFVLCISGWPPVNNAALTRMAQPFLAMALGGQGISPQDVDIAGKK
jgi:hypothetical protein